MGFGLASAVLHAGAVAAVAMLMTRPLPPQAPDQPAVEMIFQQEDPPAAVAEPVADAQPEPPPPAPVAEPPPPEPAPPPESKPPPPEPPPPEPPPPEPPPPEPPPPPPKPKPLPPKPVVRPVVARPPVDAPRPAPAAPSPMAAPVAPAVDPSWQAAVFGWIASRKTYPEEARRRGEEGRVSIRFTVDRSGRVMEAAISGPSGSARLDEAALALLRQASLPAFPAAMTQPRITITTTMRYSLR